MDNIKEVLLTIPKNSIIRITNVDGESDDTLFFEINSVDDLGCLIEGIDMSNGCNSTEIIIFNEDKELIKNIEIVKTLNDEELIIEKNKLQELNRNILEEINESNRCSQ